LKLLKFIILIIRPVVKTNSFSVTENLKGACLFLSAGAFPKKDRGKVMKNRHSELPTEIRKNSRETVYTPSVSLS